MTRERNPFGPIAASRRTSRTIFFYVPTIYRAVHRNASNPTPKIRIAQQVIGVELMQFSQKSADMIHRFHRWTHNGVPKRSNSRVRQNVGQPNHLLPASELHRSRSRILCVHLRNLWIKFPSLNIQVISQTRIIHDQVVAFAGVLTQQLVERLVGFQLGVDIDAEQNS
ncbi:MAG: hypothetical protein JWN70_3491 [Planctomycetaceae bacterium]|nr:hypothetical protein [Planctomycetaceae bacterium]